MFNPNRALPLVPPSQEVLQLKLRLFMTKVYPVLLETGVKEACSGLLDFFVDNSIKMIASDFDLTMTTIHSHGYVLRSQYSRSPVFSALSEHFNYFGAQANDRGLAISVVTFSDEVSMRGAEGLAGENLVVGVLQNSQALFTIEKVYGYYPANYQHPEQYGPLGLEEAMHNSKRFHLRQLCHDFQLNPWEVVLIDDDLRNCRTAVEDGFLSLGVVQSRGFDFAHIAAL